MLISSEEAITAGRTEIARTKKHDLEWSCCELTSCEHRWKSIILRAVLQWILRNR